MKAPVFGERRIVKTYAGFLEKYEVRLQEYRSAWFGLAGHWVTLVYDSGYADIKGSVESALRRVQAKADRVFANECSDEVVWSSTSDMEPRP